MLLLFIGVYIMHSCAWSYYRGISGLSWPSLNDSWIYIYEWYHNYRIVYTFGVSKRSLYHDEDRLLCNKMIITLLYNTYTLCWILIELSTTKQPQDRHIAHCRQVVLTLTPNQPVFVPTTYCCVLSGEISYYNYNALVTNIGNTCLTRIKKT